MKVTFLGTASCFPTPTRGVSCTAIQLEDGQIWIFDCGECSQVQLQKSKLKPGKITKIFITHLHGDHLFGLPGLLCSLGNFCSTEAGKSVDLYGPLGLKNYITTCLETSRSPLPYELNVYEMLPESSQYSQDWGDWPVDLEGVHLRDMASFSSKIESELVKGTRCWTLFKNNRYHVSAGAIEHRIPSFGYVIEEQDQVGSLDVEKLKTLGLQPGPLYSKLKLGQPVTIPDTDTEVRPEDVIGKPKKGRKIVIMGDTCNSDAMAPLCQNVDLLIHEATMENSMVAKAMEFGHSTPKMAAEFALKVNARQLCLTHVSPRYKPVSQSNEDDTDSAQKLLNEAVTSLGDSTCVANVAEDFTEISVFTTN